MAAVLPPRAIQARVLIVTVGLRPPVTGSAALILCLTLMPELPSSVRIREVGPRDGFQNEPEVIATADKVRLIDMLGADRAAPAGGRRASCAPT